MCVNNAVMAKRSVAKALCTVDRMIDINIKAPLTALRIARIQEQNSGTHQTSLGGVLKVLARGTSTRGTEFARAIFRSFRHEVCIS